jgi:poly(3-hydroxybutyrate) depolymerase
VGVTYPDVFAAIGANSGLEYKATTSYNASRPLLTGSPGPNPVQQGQVIKQAMGPYARRRPTLVFHGTADTIVPYIHGVEIAISMASANALVDPTFTNSDYLTPDSNLTGHVPNGHLYHASSWNDEYDKPVVQFFTVLGMDHRWSGGAPANVSGAGAWSNIESINGVLTDPL